MSEIEIRHNDYYCRKCAAWYRYEWQHTPWNMLTVKQKLNSAWNVTLGVLIGITGGAWWYIDYYLPNRAHERAHKDEQRFVGDWVKQ